MIFLLLMLSLHAVVLSDEFVKKYTEADQQLAISKLNTEGGDYFIIRLDGQETFLVDNVTGKQVDELGGIERLLREDVYIRAGFANKTALMREKVADFNSTRAPEEAKCRQYTGTGTHQCKDRESCIVACFAVPVCTALINADGFWQSIYSWSENTYEIDRLSGEFESGINGMEMGGSAIESQIARLDSIVSIARENQENGLFKGQQNPECVGPEGVHCYDFCPVVDYSISSLLSARSTLVVLKTQLSALGLQGERAKKIAERGAAQIEYINGRGAMLARHRLFVVEAQFNATRAFEGLNRTIQDGQAWDTLSELMDAINISEQYEKAGRFRLEFATAGNIGRLSEEVAERAETLLAQKKKLESDLEAAKGKIGKAAGVGANASVLRGLNFTHTRLEQKLSERLQSSKLGEISSQISQLDKEANDAILGAILANQSSPGAVPTTSVNITGTEVKVPKEVKCTLPFAIFAFALIGAFFARREC
jgi:hypothetical protein